MAATHDPSFTRRTVLASAGFGAGAAALGGTPALAQTGLLVHGAWHGGWCWRRVSDLLEKQGHNVFKWEDLKDVCLVVHSYGGWPGSGALEQIGDRVSSIVWLDAFKPENGQRGFDFASEISRKGFLAAVEKGEPGRPAPTAEAFRVISEKVRAWVDSKTTPQPNGVAMQPIKLTGARETVAKKTYIRAAKYPQPAFDQALAECKADKSWRTFEATESGHDVMVDAPQWLVDVLLQVS